VKFDANDLPGYWVYPSGYRSDSYT